VVFRGKYDENGEAVAIKSVSRDIVLEIQKHAPNPEYAGNIRKLTHLYIQQVRNEWRLGHRLTNLAGGHVGIPRMHRLHTERDLLLRPEGVHLVMDYVEGTNLRRGHNYSIPQLIRIYRQAADILRFMHQHNVVHADMKPHHIIVDDTGHVQILDLGLACKRQGHMAQVVGSPNYMAPEQLAGAGIDERTDVYGLGATMFWALTERSVRPNISGGVAMGSLDLQMKQFETSVRQYNPDCPPALEEIVMRSCSPSRRSRFALTEVIARLDRLM
jgi:eukaryotic-like serine/threonine-protein kinase